ncbi:hypothetical protein [Alkalihalobacterium chitinilyticum]|uniref:Uncharacterized protein n=1 Tax=Alkalihalobacterium chitinilyticum TaxID=2980103 RepID=A0ABT5VKJ7_9BACI|nr:hypothetical protein [Alkalihalobacterium chitinilyticum]MDE5414764.1 hypothetical protein [Alkalihalobacterium chitinilyticum]
MSTIDINAIRKWKGIPDDFKQKILSNVFCINCGVTTIINYSIHDDSDGILLKGVCKKCKEPVARCIED